MSTMSRDICLRCLETSQNGGGGIRTHALYPLRGSHVTMIAFVNDVFAGRGCEAAHRRGLGEVVDEDLMPAGDVADRRRFPLWRQARWRFFDQRRKRGGALRAAEPRQFVGVLDRGQ